MNLWHNPEQNYESNVSLGGRLVAIRWRHRSWTDLQEAGGQADRSAWSSEETLDTEQKQTVQILRNVWSPWGGRNIHISTFSISLRTSVKITRLESFQMPIHQIPPNQIKIIDWLMITINYIFWYVLSAATLTHLIRINAAWFYCCGFFTAKSK